MTYESKVDEWERTESIMQGRTLRGPEVTNDGWRRSARVSSITYVTYMSFLDDVNPKRNARRTGGMAPPKDAGKIQGEPCSCVV